MDASKNVTDASFSLPVALLVSNDTFTNGSFEFNGSFAANSQDWNKIVKALNEERKTERIGETITRELKWAFILHAYGFGCLFFILAFYTFFSVLNLRSFISSRPFMSTINGFLCLLGASRAGSLLIDPYNLKENIPKIIGQIIWDLGFPSIISAFCLVQLAFLQLTQLEIGPESLRRKSCLSLIVTAHFMLTVGLDIVVASHENLLIVKHVIQYIFLGWGVILCSNFLYSGYKVMAMIRNIPGGLKHRDMPDPSYKGIMQLAILAPHNNLAGSVTAALLPTLCAPKIHQQDNTSLSAVGFRSDGNSRILESESIPIVEEMAGFSGDEKSSKNLTRKSSFQNQTRNTQKFSFKPKLSLKSMSDEDINQTKNPNVKFSKSPSPKNQSPKSLTRGNEFDFNTKPNSGILKHTENFVTTKNIQEFKSKIHLKGEVENENLHSCRRKSKNELMGNCHKSGNEVPQSEIAVPSILISCAENEDDKGEGDGDKNLEFKSQKEENGENECEKNFACFMNEILHDFSEMEIMRDENNVEKEMEINRDTFCNSQERIKNQSSDSRRGSKKSGEKKDSLTYDSTSSTETMNTKRPIDTSSLKGLKKSKMLSWKKKSSDEKEEEGETAAQECLLPQENITDVSLRSVLNHIAYINRSQQANTNTGDDLEKVGKSKVEWVLNITYITAMWGLMLCLSNISKIYNPFGMPETRLVQPSSASHSSPLFNTTQSSEFVTTEQKEQEILFSPWPWLWFQTFCRALELAMGCAMANITRQPAANYRYSRTLNMRHRDNFYNI